jgi:hypothetical protein
VPFTEEALQAVVADYEDRKRQLLHERDAQLRAFQAQGWRPVDLGRVTGYSRETIRQALRPEVRQATNAGRRKASPVGVDGGRYEDTRPYVVADDLDDLVGPVQGSINLPRHLDWSGRAAYELDRPARLASMYKAVLNEAGTVQDLRDWINGRVLTDIWPSLWLPVRLRRLWEDRFPVLAARRVAVA